MQANFSLQTLKPVVAFSGIIMVDWLKRVFKFKDEEFIHWVTMVLGESFLDAVCRYRTKTNIASMLMAWCLELCLKDEAFWIVSLCVREEWCLGLASLMTLARPNEMFRGA
ncbi:hypothetical protein SUGI_0047390 [Cryptomeria japonica]|nr:hypothetical protein SUGI_0047390 [Cryptomeria japonica]